MHDIIVETKPQNVVSENYETAKYFGLEWTWPTMWNWKFPLDPAGMLELNNALKGKKALTT